MMREEKKKEIINRLKTLKGHIAGIEKMVEEEKCCEDILLQVTAIKASIHKVSLLIIEQHVKECLVNDIDGETLNKEQLEKALNTIIKFVK